MVRAGDYEVDGWPFGEEVVQAELGAAGRGAVFNYDPVIVTRGVAVVPGAVGVECVGVHAVGG